MIHNIIYLHTIQVLSIHHTVYYIQRTKYNSWYTTRIQHTIYIYICETARKQEREKWQRPVYVLLASMFAFALLLPFIWCSVAVHSVYFFSFSLLFLFLWFLSCISLLWLLLLPPPLLLLIRCLLYFQIWVSQTFVFLLNVSLRSSLERIASVRFFIEHVLLFLISFIFFRINITANNKTKQD